MFFFEKWQTLLISLELYKHYGADLLVIPLLSAIDKLFAVLRAYEQSGRVRLKPAVLIPKFVSFLIVIEVLIVLI
jgi:hypothetical protein